MVKLLKKIFGEEFGDPERFQSIVDLVKSTDNLPELDAETLETICYLIAGAVIPASWSLRSLSVEALFLLRFEFTALHLAVIFFTDKHENVRVMALHGLVSIIGEKAEPLIYKAFEDPSPAVRKAALESFYRMPKEVWEKALPHLQPLTESDPNEEVRRLARSVAKLHK